MANKPTASLVLLIIGGLFVLGFGAAELSGGLAASHLPSNYTYNGVTLNTGILGLAGSVLEALGALGIVCGIVMILSGVMAYTKQPKTWGIIGLVFSIISLGSLGGLFIGFILGLIGSILAIVFKG